MFRVCWIFSAFGILIRSYYVLITQPLMTEICALVGAPFGDDCVGIVPQCAGQVVDDNTSSTEIRLGRSMVGAVVYRNLVRLELIESVRPDYLIRFLKPYEAYCKSRKVYLDGIVFNQEWTEHLYRVLAVGDPKMPLSLRQALIDIADLVGESEHDQIITAAKERQLDLFKRTELVNPAELAFKMYLEHPALFEESRARVQSSDLLRRVDLSNFSPKMTRRSKRSCQAPRKRSLRIRSATGARRATAHRSVRWSQLRTMPSSSSC